MDRVESKEQEEMAIMPDLIRELIGTDSDVTTFAKSLGVSRNVVTNWLLGRSGVKLKYLIKISKLYGISVDYMLGISDYRSPNANIQGAQKLTGLSEESIKTLYFVNGLLSHHPAFVLDALIADIPRNISDSPKDVLSQIYSLFIFDHLNQPYKIINGDCEVDNTPEITRDAEIKLTDEMMLDVILDGIQRSLLRIRENLKAGEIDGVHK